MGMLYTFQSSYVPMRTSDITADDTLLDPTASGSRLTDFSTKDIYTIGIESNKAEIVFAGEADNTDHFGCRMWAGAHFGQGNVLVAELICDLTGQAGTAWADLTSVDASSRLFADTLTLDSDIDAHIGVVAVCDNSSNRYAKLTFDVYGYKYLYPEFYTIGDTTEYHRINAYIRTF